MLTEDRIKDQNAIHGEANVIEGHLLRILSPWQGLKVRKISGHGGYVAKLQTELDRYCSDHGYNVEGGRYWLNVYASYTSLIARLRDASSTASPVELYVGRFDDKTGILTALGDGTERRTDYTLGEVEQALAAAYQLEEQARQLRSSVSVFARR